MLCARNYSFKDDYEAAIPKKPSQSYVAPRHTRKELQVGRKKRKNVPMKDVLRLR